MRDLTGSHLDALEAQARLLLASIDGLRHHIASLTPPAAVPDELPERCAGYAAMSCVEQGAEGKPCGGFGSTKRMCGGCGTVFG